MFKKYKSRLKIMSKRNIIKIFYKKKSYAAIQRPLATTTK